VGWGDVVRLIREGAQIVEVVPHDEHAWAYGGGIEDEPARTQPQRH
jgi:hypothetical protein